MSDSSQDMIPDMTPSSDFSAGAVSSPQARHGSSGEDAMLLGSLASRTINTDPSLRAGNRHTRRQTGAPQPSAAMAQAAQPQDATAEQTTQPASRNARTTYPTSHKKRNIKIGIAAAFAVAAAAYNWNHIEDAAYSLHHKIELAQMPADNQPGIGTVAQSEAMISAAQGLAQVYDSLIFVRYDKSTNTVTRGPLFDEMKALASELGRSADYQRFEHVMDAQWVGIPAGAGGIQNEKRNPGGTLAGIGGFAMKAQVQRVSDMLQGYEDLMRSWPGYATAINNYPNLKTAMESAPERRRVYAVMMGQQPSADVAGTRNSFAANGDTRDMAGLMPVNATTHSPEFLTLRTVVESLNQIRPDIKINAETLSRTLFSPDTSPRGVCVLATQWRDLDANLRTYPEYPQAVRLAQQQLRAAGRNINVQQSLDKSRDIATQTAINAQESQRNFVQRALGFRGCNAN